jgi:hypothetical protein
MRKITNQELIDSLFSATEQDRVDWQPTGTTDQYAASFGGKWTVLIDKISISGGTDRFWMEVKDSTGETIVRVTHAEDNRIREIFEMARRQALKIDEALADLLKELRNPQK